MRREIILSQIAIMAISMHDILTARIRWTRLSWICRCKYEISASVREIILTSNDMDLAQRTKVHSTGSKALLMITILENMMQQKALRRRKSASLVEALPFK